MKMIYYECKRIWLGRLFPVMLICNCVYACIWMWNVGIEGVGGTAPFSAWTYHAYCGNMLPAAVLTLLLLQSVYYTPRWQKADILPLASPCSAEKLMLCRMTALLICGILIFAAEYLIFVLPCILFFKETAVLAYGLTGLLPVLSLTVLALSLGGLLGRFSGKLIYLLAVILFIIGMLHIQKPYDLFCGGFFAQYPLTLPAGADGEPPFRILPVWIFTRLLFLAAGAAVTVWNVCRHRKPKRVETV